MKTIDIPLNDGFEYHHKNGTEVINTDAKFITISMYTMKQMDKAAPVKEIVMHAMAAWGEKLDKDDAKDAIEDAKAKQEKESDDEKHTIGSGKEYMSIISQYCDKDDLGRLWAHMKRLLSAGICSIDGETPLHGGNITELSMPDFEMLCGEYIGNFITS